MLNIIKENFRKIPKEEKLSADEQIIPFKGRSNMKQHMPKKPHRWGYKMFVLAGGDSGISLFFIQVKKVSLNMAFVLRLLLICVKQYQDQ